MYETGFLDTINLIFSDDKNILNLEGEVSAVTGIYLYKDGTYETRFGFHKLKIYVNWYVRNQYNELIDSISTTNFSGDYVEFNFDRMMKDAITTSYLSLHNNERMIEHIKFIDDNKIEGEYIKLKASNPIASFDDAKNATVIIVNKDNHGSGFVISNDGYILTNYHVISNKYPDKFNKIEVLLSDGKKHTAKVVRYNKASDLVLLKVDSNFEKVFILPDNKSFHLCKIFIQ
jgi:S1-C subfamily serine protease